MIDDKTAVKEAMLQALHGKAGVWVSFDVLCDLLFRILGETAYRGTLNRVIYELIRDNQIQRTKQTKNIKGITFQETLYRVPDNETPDLFGGNEVQK